MELLKEVQQIQNENIKWLNMTDTLKEVSKSMDRFKDEYLAEYFTTAAPFSMSSFEEIEKAILEESPFQFEDTLLLGNARRGPDPIRINPERNYRQEYFEQRIAQATEIPNRYFNRNRNR